MKAYTDMTGHESTKIGAQWMLELLDYTMSQESVKNREAEPRPDEVQGHFKRLWDAEPEMMLHLKALSLMAGHLFDMLQLIQMTKLTGISYEEGSKTMASLVNTRHASHN